MKIKEACLGKSWPTLCPDYWAISLLMKLLIRWGNVDHLLLLLLSSFLVVVDGCQVHARLFTAMFNRMLVHSIFLHGRTVLLGVQKAIFVKAVWPYKIITYVVWDVWHLIVWAYSYWLHCVLNRSEHIWLIFHVEKLFSIYIGERQHGVWSSGARWDQNGIENGKEIELSTQIKLARHGVARYSIKQIMCH